MKEHSDDVPHVVSPVKATARMTESNINKPMMEEQDVIT